MFLQKDGELSLAEIAELSGFNKTTAYRMASTLVKRRYLNQREKNGKYYLGLRTLDYAYAIRKNIQFIELVYLHLSKLVKAENISAYISILDDDSSLVVEEVAAVETMRINSPIGKRLPLHATACGKVLLSSLSGEERKSFYMKNELRRFTSMTVTDTAQLESEVARAIKYGVAFGEEDYKMGLMSIAAPIYNGGGNIIAAAGIVAPLSQFNSIGRDHLAQELKSCTAEISQVIGRVS